MVVNIYYLILAQNLTQNVEVKPATTEAALPELSLQSHPIYGVFPDKIKAIERIRGPEVHISHMTPLLSCMIYYCFKFHILT